MNKQFSHEQADLLVKETARDNDQIKFFCALLGGKLDLQYYTITIAEMVEQMVKPP